MQGKTLFIWQIKVAKTAKAKLCATKNRHNYLKFCAFAKKNRSFFVKPRLQRLPKRSSVLQEEALCHKARHRGSRDALTHKNSLLTKRREPKPTNSACAEFANQNAGFIGGNRHTIQEFCFAEFLRFCTRLLLK